MSASAPQAATPPTLAMVAGEASGDLLASLMIRGLRARWPHAKMVGIGGPRMAEQGFEAWWPHEKLAVRGYVEVLRHYREIVGIRSQLKARLLATPPQIFVGVDAPDFNLDLARDLRQAGIPTAQFVCPSIWAWRPERVEKIRQSVDHVLCLFPFEPELLAQHGIAATYVGHPLAQAIAREPDRAAARLRLGLALDATVVALLPGSRASEIQYLAPRFLRAAQCMAAQRPGLHFVLPAVPSLRQVMDRHVAQVGGVPGLQVRRRDGTWIDAPQPEGAFICNIGDCLMRWSNDVYLSTPHRVLPPARERYSIAFFLDPNPEARVSALPSCVPAGQAPRHPDITAEAHLQQRLAATYAGRAGANQAAP